MARREGLTDEQWAIIEPLLPPPVIREDGKGRPRVHDNRSVLNGVLWVLRTGAAWADLPERFPSSSTCYRRFSYWVKTAALRKVLEILAQDLEVRGKIDLSECFIDGTFVVAKKGGLRWERPSGARVRSSWQLQTLMVFHSACTQLLLHPACSHPCRGYPRSSLHHGTASTTYRGPKPTTLIRSIIGSKTKALK
jgi:transposase